MPHLRFTRSRRITAVLMSAIAVGCTDDPLAVEVPAPGAPAQIVWSSISVAGGREFRHESRFDSASQHYTLRMCSDAAIGVPCTNLRLEREGPVVTPTIESLFRSTNDRRFRALNSQYSRPAGATPPDNMTSTLEITRNGFRRTITWQDGAFLPTALLEFTCALLAARGELILCD